MVVMGRSAPDLPRPAGTGRIRGCQGSVGSPGVGGWTASRGRSDLSVVSFLADVSSEMVYPLIPLFLTGGAPATAVGVVEGVARGTANVTKFS